MLEFTRMADATRDAKIRTLQTIWSRFLYDFAKFEGFFFNIHDNNRIYCLLIHAQCRADIRERRSHLIIVVAILELLIPGFRSGRGSTEGRGSSQKRILSPDRAP